MGRKRWNSATDQLENEIRGLSESHSFPRPVAMFFKARGIETNEVDQYIGASLKSLSDPFRFPNIDKAVARMWDAVRNREPILIHGDYDTDGITATALLAWVLEANGAKVHTFLPHRFDDGYGFTVDSLEKGLASCSEGCKLLITVDCGVTSFEAAEKAAELGVDVIITDHHEPEDHLPPALAVINPKVYPELADLHNLSGVGAAFKLSHAFIKYGRLQNLGGFTTNLKNILDYVALGTIADIVPLLGENRILVKHGLKTLKKQLRPGIRALFETARVGAKVQPSDVTFKLAPRINAAGRLGNANVALSLLNTDNIVEAYRFANELENFNVRRQQTEQEIFIQARQQIVDNIDLETRYSILVAGEGWHQGVIGIVASRLSREFNRPAIVLTIQGEEAHGSGRSVGTLNMVKGLHSCAQHLERFGGHPMAVGLGLERDRISAFSDDFELFVRESMDASDLVEQVTYDGEIELNELSMECFDLFEQLEPFGHGNRQPCYRLRGLEPIKLMPAGAKHSHGVLRDHTGTCMDFIFFGRTVDSLPTRDWDILGTPQINDFYGDRRPQIHITDIQD